LFCVLFFFHMAKRGEPQKDNPEGLDVWDAAERGDAIVLRHILSAEKGKLLLNAKGAWQRTPLHWASANGQLNCVKVLVEFGADVNAQDETGWTPLHFACNNAHKKIVQFLIPIAQLNIEDAFNRSPLHFAKKRSIRNLLLCVKEPENTLSDDLGKLVNDQATSDIAFDLKGTLIYAHRGILVARSEYFRSLLLSGMKESSSGTKVITLQEEEHSTFVEVLKYIYTNELKAASLEKAVQLLQAADRYCLLYMKHLCELLIEKKLTLENVSSMCSLADDRLNNRLKDICFQFILQHADKVSNLDLDFNSKLWGELISFLEQKGKLSESKAKKLRNKK